MKKIVKATSVNCEVCSREVLSYQIRTAKVNSVLKDICPSCHENTKAYKEFKESLDILKDLQKYSQEAAIDPMTDTPNVSVEPIDSNIQAACELLKRMDGNYFKGVSKIVAGAEANYGHVSSGPDQDPHVVHINLNRITSENTKSKRDIIVALAITISHEVAHTKSFKDGAFSGGEGVAEAEERKVSAWIKANEARLQDLFK
jgi:hypothetical protein